MKNHERLSGCGLAAVALLLSLNLALADDRGSDATGASEAAGKVVRGTTMLRGASFATISRSDDWTTNTVWTVVPETHAQFSNTGGPLIIEFSAEAFGYDDAAMLVSAVVDGVTTAEPGIVMLAGDPDEDGDYTWARAHHFTWVCPQTKAGPHMIQILWLSLDGKPVKLGVRTLVVYGK